MRGCRLLFAALASLILTSSAAPQSPTSVPNRVPSPPLSPASPAVSVPSVAVSWYDGMDAPNNHFGNIDIEEGFPGAANAEDCIRKCAQDSTCVGVTYNVQRSICFPKKRIGGLIYSREAATTGVLTERSPAPDTTPGPHVRHYENRDARGTDLGKWIPNLSSFQCESVCILDDDCVGYTYNRSRATCIPKRIVDQIVNSPEPAVTGIVEGR